MKIKDILNRLDVIAEASEQPAQQPALVIPQSLTNKIANDPNNKTLAQQNQKISGQAAQTAPNTAYKGSAGAQAIAQANGITDVNKIQAGKTITVNGQPYKIKPGDTLDKIAAANKVGAAPAKPAAAPAADNGLGQNAPGVSSAVADAQGTKGPSNAAELAAAQGKPVPDETADAETGTEPSQATMAPAPEGPTGQDAPSAENEKAKMGLAAGSPALQQQQAAAPNQSPDEIARLQQLGGIQPQMANPLQPDPTQAANPMRGVAAFGQNTGGQAAQPDAAAPAAPNPDTVAPVVKTGSGGTLTTRDGKAVTSRSNDEIAWAQKNPYQPYPGPGWQEKQKAQGQKNLDALKGVGNKIANFFSGGKKAPPAPADQAQQPAAAPPQQQMTMESELSMIKHLSGLK